MRSSEYDTACDRLESTLLRSQCLTLSTTVPYIRCALHSPTSHRSFDAVTGSDSPSAGTPLTCAPSETAAPNGTPHPARKTGATSTAAPYSIATHAPNA